MRPLAPNDTHPTPGSTGRLISDRGLVLLVVVVAMVSPARAFTAAQAQAGADIYKRHCARCHGVTGEGEDNTFKGLRAPALIGAHALPCDPRPLRKIRTRQFRTAQDVYAFTSATQPADHPASLDEDDYWNVIAYLLQANGAPADETRLDAAASAQAILHTDCTPPSRTAEQAQP